jgi:putative glutamine amidotransferase
MPRPRIGITTALEQARWTVWDQEAFLLSRSYVDAVQRAGGAVLMLPPDPLAADDPDPIVNGLDGLILSGGADIDPAAYGEQAHPETRGTWPERDAFELAITRRALELDLPVFGICRGMQLLNVALGGTLLQHVPDSVGHTDHRRTPGSFDNADHDVRLQPGSLAALAAQETVHGTKSHHHQAVERLGEGLVVTGWSSIDDLPEAVECPGRGWVLGVQWHPEVDPGSQVLDSFVAAASVRRERRASAARAA